MNLFDYELFIHLLALAGAYAIALWLYDNLKSPFQVMFNVFKSLLFPQSNKSLIEKYGNWAGMYVITFLPYCVGNII